MSVERGPGDFPDVERLVVTDRDGDALTLDRHPSGNVLVEACTAVLLSADDRAAVAAFLTEVTP